MMNWTITTCKQANTDIDIDTDIDGELWLTTRQIGCGQIVVSVHLFNTKLEYLPVSYNFVMY